MDIGMVGLGKMGADMAERLVRDGHRVVGYDRAADAVEHVRRRGVEGVDSLEELVGSLSPRRAIWMMVPAGDPVDATIATLTGVVDDDDILVDGGNSNYHDTIRRAAECRATGIHLVDVGTSGGVWGLAEGYSMAIGGDDDPVEFLRPVFETLAPAPDRGWGRTGASGAGHYVKMIHNGIEYGLMQAYAEGFTLLASKTDYDFDLTEISRIWEHGSVIRSWLLELMAGTLAEDPALDGIAPWVHDSGEGRWTVFEAIDLDVSAPVISLSLMRRLHSRDDYAFSDRLLAATRNRFGGHGVKRA